MSEETKHDCLTAALVAAQSEFPPLERSSEVNIKTKNGASFNYSYASLDTLRGQTDSILHKHGLVVNHSTRLEGDRVILITQIAHADSKEQQTAEWPVGSVDDDPKDLGANMTYGMRYTYSALTGRVAEDDSDAQRTKKPAPKKQQRKKEYATDVKEEYIPDEPEPNDFGESQSKPPKPAQKKQPREDFPPNVSSDDEFRNLSDSPPPKKDSATLARVSCMARVSELKIDDAWVKQWLMAEYKLKESRNEMTEEQWKDARNKLNEMVTKADGILEGQVIVLNKHLTELGYTGTDDAKLLAVMKASKLFGHLSVADAKQLAPPVGAQLIDKLWDRIKANRAKAKADASD